MDFEQEALKKLEKEFQTVSGQKETAMKKAVRETLESFIRQDGEFAQAVAQGGTFSECMKAVANGVGNSISDLDAYKKAVEFYFKGADVEMTLRIRLAGDPEKPAERKTIVLDLEDFL